MKSFRISIDNLLTDENVRQAFLKPANGKRNRADVAKVLAELEKHITIVQDMIRSGGFVPPRHPDVLINEKGYQKQRTIRKPDYKYEQVVHHVVVSGIKDGIEHGMYAYVLGSVPGRGAHLGKKRINRWIREDPANTKYVFKMDIRHFFQSVDHDILKRWLAKKFRDKYMLDLMYLIIDANDMGLALGFYTSQWFANFLLQPLDHYIKEVLGVKYMTRYMDDIVCFGANKRHLHRVKDAVERYLAEELNLTMKGNWQVFRFEYEQEDVCIQCHTLKDLRILDATMAKAKIGHHVICEKRKTIIVMSKREYERKQSKADLLIKQYGGCKREKIRIYGRPLDYMGFEFHRHKTIMRESIMIRAARRARKIGKSAAVCWKTAASFLSCLGWLNNTNTYDMYLQRIKPFVNIKAMKKVVSKHQRRINKNESGMGNSGGLQTGAA